MKLLSYKSWKSPKSNEDGLSFQQQVKLSFEVYQFACQLEKLLQNGSHPTFNHYFQKALSFYHRFAHQVSLAKFNRHIYIVACLFLSAKDNDMFDYSVEIDKYAKNFIICCSGTKSDDVQTLVEKIIDAESHILQIIGYDLHITVPQNYLLEARQIITVAQGEVQKLFDVAQTHLNDIFYTNACLYYEPKVLALTAIEQAAISLKMTLQDLNSGEPWYSLFHGEYNEIQQLHLYLDENQKAL